MSFRDYTPRTNQQQCTPLKKGPLRRTTSNTYTGTSALSQEQQQQQKKKQQQQQQHRLDLLPLTRSRSDLISYDNHYYHGGDAAVGGAAGGGVQSQHHLLIQQREEEYALRVMQQREEELLDINRKMHVVDEIYKDLGEIVGQQQETIDELEDRFERTEETTRRGLEQLEKANKKHDRRKDKKGDNGNDEGPEDRTNQFFLFAYLSKKASEISRLISVCGGSGSVDYVHGECCRNP